MTTSVEDPLIELEVHGDLSIKGRDELEVSVKTGSPEETRLEQLDESIRLFCPDDCKVVVPREARLRLTKIDGDAGIKAVEGEIEVIDLKGTLRLRSVGPMIVRHVDGNVEGKNFMDSLEIQSVRGNVVLRDVQGDFTAGEVEGNLVLDDLDGSVTARAKGNVTLRLDPAPGAEYEVVAEGNVTCSLPADASVKIEVRRAGRVHVNLPGVHEGRIQELPYALTLAEGDSSLTIEAGGQVMLNSQAPDWNFTPDFQVGEEMGTGGEAFAEQINRQIETQIRNMEQQLNSQLANLNFSLGTAGFSQEQIERMQERVREASERVSERVQDKLERAQERLERKMAHAQRNAERHARAAEARARAAAERAYHREHRAWRGHVPPPEPETPHAPVSDEERMLILKMLQEKKITVEDAESLLSALEGKERS